MILDVDIGNSRLKWRLQDRLSGVLPRDRLSALREALAGHSVSHIRAACVAGPVVEQQFSDWCRGSWGVQPKFARVREQCAGVTVGYNEPGRLGVDRWLAVLAAYRATGGACVVVDAGSALTVDYVGGDGCHSGGLILPGLGAMSEALSARTHAVRAGPLALPRAWAPGRDTESCVANGLAAAVKGLMAEVIRSGEERYGAHTEFLICGGDGETVASFNPRLQVHRHLVLDGLALALESEVDISSGS